MHEPLPEPDTTLHDLGFEALPYLDVDAVSEVLVYCGEALLYCCAAVLRCLCTAVRCCCTRRRAFVGV